MIEKISKAKWREDPRLEATVASGEMWYIYIYIYIYTIIFVVKQPCVLVVWSLPSLWKGHVGPSPGGLEVREVTVELGDSAGVHSLPWKTSKHPQRFHGPFASTPFSGSCWGRAVACCCVFLGDLGKRRREVTQPVRHIKSWTKSKAELFAAS